MALKNLKYLLFGVIVLTAYLPAKAQDADILRGQLRASNENTLMGRAGQVQLWGVERVEGLSATEQSKARMVLDDAVEGAQVHCRVRERLDDGVAAQCMGAEEQDLALWMLRQGYVSADRAQVFGSVYEDAYIDAEREAQLEARGIWGHAAAQSGGALQGNGMLIVVLCFVLFLFVIVTFVIMHIIIRGFEKVSAAQERHADMIGRERALKDKERSIVATMLNSEIRANKSKIDAYLIVYEEMLVGLKNPERQPKYKKAGDIVQKQPALDRAVFDGNADKLDALGDRLSSAVIHFYARIKSKPDYMTLEPDTPLEEAIAMVEKGVAGAKRMNDIADTLIQDFQDKEADESNDTP